LLLLVLAQVRMPCLYPVLNPPPPFKKSIDCYFSSHLFTTMKILGKSLIGQLYVSRPEGSRDHDEIDIG